MSENNSIEKMALTGLMWKFLERFLAKGTSFIVSIIIARILDPNDYSVVSIVTIFFGFADVIISGGFNTALIQKKEPDALDYSTVLITSLAVSLVVYAILFTCAPWIATIYHLPILVSVIRIMGLILPVNAVKSVWCAYISHQLQFRKFFYATIGGTILSGIIGILMAIQGFGPWALVVQQLVNMLTDAIILILTTKIQMTRGFSIVRFKSLFSYGWRILLSSILGKTYSQFSPLVIGLKYTTTELAFYDKGLSFPALISSSTTDTIAAVLFPVLSKKQDNKDEVLSLTRLYMRISSFIVFPAMMGLYAISGTFVYALLTEKWAASIIYMRIFCISYMFDMVALGNCESIKAIGRSDIYLKMEIAKKTGYFLTLVLFLCLTDNPDSFAFSALVCTLIQVLVNSWPNRKLIGYHYLMQINDLMPNLLTATVMCVGVMIVGKIVKAEYWLTMCIQIVFGIVCYLLLSIATKNSSFNYIVSRMKKIGAKKDDKSRIS